jgi:hypothetical protein
MVTFLLLLLLLLHPSSSSFFLFFTITCVFGKQILGSNPTLAQSAFHRMVDFKLPNKNSEPEELSGLCIRVHRSWNRHPILHRAFVRSIQLRSLLENLMLIRSPLALLPHSLSGSRHLHRDPDSFGPIALYSFPFRSGLDRTLPSFVHRPCHAMRSRMPRFLSPERACGHWHPTRTSASFEEIRALS